MRPLFALVICWGISVAVANGQEVKTKVSYELVYEIVAPPNVKDAPAVDMAALRTKVGRRLDLLFPALKHREEIADQTLRIDLADAEAAEIDKTKQIIETPCLVEFRILANERDHDHDKIIELAQVKDAPAKIVDPMDAKKILAEWVRLDELRIPKDQRHGMILREKNEKPEVLVVMDEFNVSGNQLEYARLGIARDKLALDFKFNEEGAKKFSEFTACNRPDPARNLVRRLGIILDGFLFSAPSLNDRIGAHGQITGNFTEAELQTLAAKMQAGPFPVPLKLVRESKPEPK